MLRLSPLSLMVPRARMVTVACGIVLLVSAAGLLVASVATAAAQRQAERVIAAGEVVPVEVYQPGRVTYRDGAGQVRFAAVDTGPAAAGAVLEMLIDPAYRGRLRHPEASPPAPVVAPALAAGGVVSLVSGVLLLRRPRRARGFRPLTRWEAHSARWIAYPEHPATLARRQGRPVAQVGREVLASVDRRPVLSPWLPPEDSDQPPAGSTGPVALIWIFPVAFGGLSAIFTSSVALVGGPGRTVPTVVAAVLVWLPFVVATLVVLRFRVRVDVSGRLVLPGVLRARRYHLSELVQVTGWEWWVDTSAPAAVSHQVVSTPQLRCTYLGAHFRDGRHLFHNTFLVRDHELIGRALRWWALRNRASVTPDIAFGFGLVDDPREAARCPLPVVTDDRTLRGPARRIRSGLLGAGIIVAVFAAIAIPGMASPVVNSVFGPPPDPRVLPEPCALLADVDLAGPFAPAHGEVAWQGCASAHGDRQVWLSVSPSLASAPRMVRSWTAGGAAAAPISDPALLASMRVRQAHLVLFEGGERATIVFVTDQVAGVASVADGARSADGALLDDAGRFHAAVGLVRAYTRSPPGDQPLRDFWGGGVDDSTRRAVSWELAELHVDAFEVVSWLDRTAARGPVAP